MMTKLISRAFTKKMHPLVLGGFAAVLSGCAALGGGTPEEIVAKRAQAYWDAGVRHIVALRGDVPGGAPYRAHPDGYANAIELVAGQ